MNRTPYFAEEISQTALALLALVASGKSLDRAVVQSLRSLLFSQDDHRDNRVNLTIFSGHEDGNAEPPVIIPFTSHVNNVNRYHNGFGTLSLRNKFSSQNTVPAREENNSQLRIFSPDAAEYEDDEETCCVAATVPDIRIYAE